MQEIVLLLSSIAGACTAAAIRKFPKSKTNVLSLGANIHVKNQINSLRLEKEILTKTISRLYQSDAGISKTQCDRMLLKYQHQLGIVLAKIEKLEEASKHPDLGPLGDGLVTLMDQKLSQLDKRLFELSSKINIVNQEPSKQKTQKQDPKENENKQQIQKIEARSVSSHELLKKQHKPLEITTLTEVNAIKIPDFFKEHTLQNTEIAPQIKQEKIEVVQSNSGTTEFEKPKVSEPNISPKIEKKPQPKVSLPDEDKFDDDDDLDKIKSEIMKTLSKLEQAEVE